MERKESVEDGRSEGEEGVGGREWEESEAGVANWTMMHGVGLDSVLEGRSFSAVRATAAGLKSVDGDGLAGES
jgi:hypothetical protein